MFSIQTNVNSLIAQENMRVNSDFQSKTIQRLTSGYRINQSGDDAAGLAVANKFRSDVAELSQGVRNANDGISTLQIIDGGMNNISKMIDRLKTLASQSASQTFTGDRTVLNDEFQTLMKEIDRQAQAVGLDQGGLYAKSLSVFVGGGRTAGLGAVDTSNGTVSLDLAGAAVDTKSLNLKGMQALAGGDTTDIGTGSSTHTVSDILADTGNTTDIAGYTDFYISGAGFSDAKKIKVSVNLTGVSDIDTLSTAINDAIEQAGANATAAGKAFKDAGVSSSVYTNESGGKQLAFNSSYAPIQVQAGDVMANAFMGNFSVQNGDPATRGAAISSTVHGVNTQVGTLANDVTVRISGGGLSSPVDITVASGSTTAAAVASLTAQIGSNESLVAGGISVSSGTVGSSPLTFTNDRGDKFSVMASGDSANLLGLGSFQSGAAGAVDYSTLTGSVYSGSTTSDTSTLEISLGGGVARQVTVDLTDGDASAAKSVSTALAAVNTVDNSNHTLTLAIDSQNVTVTLSNSTAATKGLVDASGGLFAGAGTLSVTAAANNNQFDLTVDGVMHTVTVADNVAYSSSNIVAAVQAGINTAFGMNIATASLDAGGNLQIENWFGPGAGQSVAINTTTGKTGAAHLGFTPGDIGYGADASGGSAISIAGQIQTQINSAGLTGGAHATVSVTQDGKISIENDNKGGAHTLVAAGNAVTSGLLTFTATAGANRSDTSIAANLNEQFAADTNLQKAGLKATVSSGALKLDSDGTYFRVNGGAVTDDADIGFGASESSFTGAAATNLAAASSARSSIDSNGAQQSASLAFTAPVYAGDAQTLTVSVNDSDGKMQSQVISLRNDATSRSARSIDEAINTINQQLHQSNIASLQGIVAVKENVSGVEKINFLSSGSSFQVSASGTTNGTGVDANGVVAGTAGSVKSSVVGDVSSTISIDSMSNALKAVTSISAAISKLGSAQAAVGRGQNQLSYALSLAQSQISSFSAAESRIRDADVAAEAANLTKAQVLQQAAVAAMAQANSAPQLILSLLRG
ncbi:flagellin [Paludibaculum fermentans]|uniref:flagellin N-terminal helical domain-containing protein n=1 Tax=Paludibaculum fermentans TaxID=1473598 RepID=UPI003EBC80A0